MLLGLDISTSITGLAILNDQGRIEKIDAVILKPLSDVFEKANAMEQALIQIKKDFNITEVAIEPALVRFQPGKSSAVTISTLIKFNGIVSFLCYKIFGLVPNYIPATSARKLCGIKVKKKEKAKPVVMKFLLDSEPEFFNMVEYTRFGNVAAKYFDMADALVIAKAHYINEH